MVVEQGADLRAADNDTLGAAGAYARRRHVVAHLVGQGAPLLSAGSQRAVGVRSAPAFHLPVVEDGAGEGAVMKEVTGGGGAGVGCPAWRGGRGGGCGAGSARPAPTGSTPWWV